MKKLKIWLKWKWLRKKSYFNKKSINKRVLKIEEQLIKNVIIKISSSPENTILISPLSRTIYIQTENKDYTVVLEEFKIKITNHKYFIESRLDDFFSRELFNIVYRYVEKSRIKMNEEIFKNEVDGLNFDNPITFFSEPGIYAICTFPKMV